MKELGKRTGLKDSDRFFKKIGGLNLTPSGMPNRFHFKRKIPHLFPPFVCRDIFGNCFSSYVITIVENFTSHSLLLLGNTNFFIYMFIIR